MDFPQTKKYGEEKKPKKNNKVSTGQVFRFVIFGLVFTLLAAVIAYVVVNRSVKPAWKTSPREQIESFDDEFYILDSPVRKDTVCLDEIQILNKWDEQILDNSSEFDLQKKQTADETIKYINDIKDKFRSDMMELKTQSRFCHTHLKDRISEFYKFFEQKKADIQNRQTRNPLSSTLIKKSDH